MRLATFAMAALFLSGCAIGSNCSLGQKEPCNFVPYVVPPGATVVPATAPR